jgi:hypothetical protein
MTSYNKLFFAIFGAVLFTVQGAMTDGIDSGEWVTIVAAGLAAFGTWLMPNTPVLETAKTWVNAVVLGAGVLAPAVLDGLSSSDLVTFGLTVLTAAGVYLIPKEQRAVRLTSD